MNTTLEMLHAIFCRPLRDAPEQQRIEHNHRRLIQAISQKQRRRVLRIIDDEDLLGSKQR